MEMRTFDTMPPNNEPSNAVSNPGTAQSLERVDQSALVPQPDATDERAELYARLRTIIDTATASIRTLKEENTALATQNTEMSQQIGALEYRIRAVTADLANDELALRRSAEVLEQVLQSPTATAPQETAARPTPLRANASEGTSPVSHASDPSAETGPMAIAPEAEPQTNLAEMETAESSTDAPAAMPEAEATEAASPLDAADMGEVSAPVVRSVAPEDGFYTLIAYPFVRFSDLGQFQAALQKLAGVHDVQVRRFAQGTLEMRVGYTGTTDLATTLRSLATEVEDVQEEEPSRLRVRLRTSQDT